MDRSPGTSSFFSPDREGSALASNDQAVTAAVNSEIAASVSTFLWLLTPGV